MYLDYNSCIAFLDFYQDVAEAFSGLRIGTDDPVLAVAQKTQQYAVVEILFSVFSDAGITDADCLLQVIGKEDFNSPCICLLKCGAESIELRSIPAGFLPEPFIDLLCEDFSDLKVRYLQLEGPGR